MKRSLLFALLQVGAFAQSTSTSTSSVQQITFTVVPVVSTTTTTTTSAVVGTPLIITSATSVSTTSTSTTTNPLLIFSPTSVSTTSSTTGSFSFDPNLTSTTSSTSSTSCVYVTVTRTFTDYCGCGIPGVSTISGTLTYTTSSSSSASNVVSPTLITTTSSSTSTPTSSTLSTTTSSSSSSSSTSTSSTTSTSGGAVVSPTLGTTSSSTSTSSTSSTSTSTSTTSTSTSSTTPSSTSTSSSSSSSSTTLTTTTTTTTTSTTTTTTTTTTSTTTVAAPIVTDQAYIDTVLRHHNVHRENHTVPDVIWSPSLASTAQKIASSCNYNHNTTVDGGGYGQNIGAGYPSVNMGQFITEGLYNSEVNSYTYYGGEPDTSTVGQWGHFSQVVWKATTSVGCYTQDCSATGLSNVPPNVPPYFTVCNYSPAGNVVGAFGQNVLRPLGNPTVYGNYGCPTAQNCV